MTIVVNDSNFEEVVLKSDLPVMIDFWAEWCGPCRALAPYVAQIATEYEGKALIGKVDVVESPEISGKYGIRNIPALLFFKGGELVKTHVGLAPKATIAKMLDDLL